MNQRDALAAAFAPVIEQALRPILDEYFAAIRPDQRTAEAHRRELPGEPKEWLTNTELQQYLGVSKMTLQRYRDSKALPYSKVGSNVYYRRADVLDLLERNVQRSD
jgi:excisionase family DNA binding protein